MQSQPVREELSPPGVVVQPRSVHTEPWRREDGLSPEPVRVARTPMAPAMSERAIWPARAPLCAVVSAITTPSTADGTRSIPGVGRRWSRGRRRWNAASWGSCSSTCGYEESTPPYNYDYGDNVTYQDGNVYFGEQSAGTEQQYAEQASALADAGVQAKPAADEKWEPLGVFAMVKGDETTSNDIFQLAINKDGIVRGNYYNAVSDSVTPVAGSLDKKTQRVAWTIGDEEVPSLRSGPVQSHQGGNHHARPHG